MTAALIAFIAGCAGLGYTGFCRLVRADADTTRLDARLSIYALTVAAAAGIVAVLAWGYRPEWPSSALACTMACVQVVGSRLWRDGVPMGFRG